MNGRDSEKFKVSYMEGGRTEAIYQWIASDVSLPVRVAAVDGNRVMEIDYAYRVDTFNQPRMRLKRFIFFMSGNLAPKTFRSS